jgi:hypothetical protein
MRAFRVDAIALHLHGRRQRQQHQGGGYQRRRKWPPHLKSRRMKIAVARASSAATVRERVGGAHSM